MHKVYFKTDDLHQIVDFRATEENVRSVLERLMENDEDLLRFCHSYTAWNGLFGSSVAILAGRIGSSRHLFIEPSETTFVLADRSVLVASYFFDAARDEFDDRDTEYRDTHRCLAQAFLKGVYDCLQIKTFAWQEPLWLQSLLNKVTLGYTGEMNDRDSLFFSMGYHLGSEVLADREFSLIDEAFRKCRMPMVEKLMSSEASISEQAHNCYQWIRIHSGHGGQAEAEHFQWALEGLNRAFDFTPETIHVRLRERVLAGFQAFSLNHQQFFENVGRPY